MTDQFWWPVCVLLKLLPVSVSFPMISLRSSGYQHIYIDINSKVVHIKLYTTKIPTSSADMRNDKVLPFYKQYGPLVLVRSTGIAYSDCVRPQFCE